MFHSEMTMKSLKIEAYLISLKNETTFLSTFFLSFLCPF